MVIETDEIGSYTYKSNCYSLEKVIIPETVINEVKKHILETINGIAGVIDVIDRDKHVISEILLKCEKSFPNILLCKKLIEKAEPKYTTGSFKYVVELINNVILHFFNLDPKSKTAYKIKSILLDRMIKINELLLN